MIREEGGRTVDQGALPAENENIVRYKGIFEKIIPIVEQHAIMDAYSATSEAAGEVNGTKFRVSTPHLRRGKHAFVGLVDITSPDGTTFSSVIRNRPEDARNYVENATTYPLIKEYVANLYGLVDNWVVMERLSGLELEELTERLKADAGFRARYAKNAFDLIQRTSNARLTLNDVAFINGHNTMVEPETAQIRLIEQRNIAPHPYYEPHELISRQVFSELDIVAHSEPEEYKLDFAFQLVKLALQNTQPQDLFIRGRRIKPTHPDYKESYFFERWEQLTEEAHQMILANPVAREELNVAYFESGNTQAFSDDLIEAVTSGDRDKFKAVMEGKKFRVDVMDKQDRRYGAVVLPDKAT